MRGYTITFDKNSRYQLIFTDSTGHEEQLCVFNPVRHDEQARELRDILDAAQGGAHVRNPST